MPAAVRHLRSVVAVTALIACSRIANQSNFIGAACKTEADCTAGLVCANDAVGIKSCQRACLDSGGCEDPEQVCTLGACRSVPTRMADSGADDASPSDASSSIPDAASEADAAQKLDPVFSGVGQTLAILTAQEVLSFTADGTWIAYARTGKNEFGVFETVLEARRADGTSTAVTFDKHGYETGKSVPAALLGGSLYWIEGGSVLKKAVPGAPELQAWTFTSEVQHIKAIGQELCAVLKPLTGAQSGHVSELARFDPVASTNNVFETQAPSLWNPAYIATNETGDLYWAHGTRDAADLAIFRTTAVAGTVDTGARIPGNLVQLASFGMTGTRAVYAAEANGSATVSAIDTAVQGATPQTIANLASSGVGSFDGSNLYLDVKAAPGGGPSVTRLALGTGVPTTVVTFPSGSYSIRVRAVDATSVYWTETLDSSVGRTIRLARAAK